MQKDKKVILITGGAGFVGSNLSERLLHDGHKVICVDSFYSGKKENIEQFLTYNNFQLIKHDIINPLKEKFEKIDEIYNLACPASPIQYQFDPVMTLRTSVDGMRNMLELARKYNAKIIQASTSEVYGDPLVHPQKEDYFGNVDPIGKRSCYDEGKRAAESLCKDYKEHYGVDVRIARLFNIYGPKMMFNDGRVVSNFILQSLLGDDITIHGTGGQSRSFMYIDDLIDAFLKLMEVSEEKIGLGPINLGNPEERTIKQLAYDIKKISRTKSEIKYISYEKIPGRLGDPQQRCPDISKAKKILNWEPKVSFEEGIKKTITDFKLRLNNKPRILIFIPSFYPFVGPAEKAVEKITNRLLGYDFDLMTGKNKKGAKKKEQHKRVNIYRVGSGFWFDKYFLPFLGVLKAIKLNKKNKYILVWGVMASYGALSSVIFSFFLRKSIMISLYEDIEKPKERSSQKLLSLAYKMIFRRLHRLQVVANISQQELAWLEDSSKIRAVDINKGWDFVAKKTKEEFQDLEIINSRL